MTSARAVPVLVVLSIAGCSWGRGAGSASTTQGASLDPARPLPSPLPEIVARVDGRAISLRQVLPLAKSALDHVSVAERDKKLPEVLRSSVERYVERELLLQEALARGISPDAEAVDWNYDQMRREHPDEAAWASFLQEQGMDPQSFRAELRIQRTVAALVERELQSLPVPESDLRAAYDANPRRFTPRGEAAPAPFESVRKQVDAAIRQARSPQVTAALLARLRLRARIELLL
jgi:hypothetical protein